jgi:hypothetical protein
MELLDIKVVPMKHVSSLFKLYIYIYIYIYIYNARIGMQKKSIIDRIHEG